MHGNENIIIGNCPEWAIMSYRSHKIKLSWSKSPPPLDGRKPFGNKSTKKATKSYMEHGCLQKIASLISDACN